MSLSQTLPLIYLIFPAFALPMFSHDLGVLLPFAGFYISWFYLRFVKIDSETGLRGDRGSQWAWAEWFSFNDTMQCVVLLPLVRRTHIDEYLPKPAWEPPLLVTKPTPSFASSSFYRAGMARQYCRLVWTNREGRQHPVRQDRGKGKGTFWAVDHRDRRSQLSSLLR